MLLDAHNHLHDDWLVPYRGQLLADLAAAGIRAVVVNGTCEADWPAVAALCAPATSSSSLQLRPSFGLHPWDAGNRSPDWQTRLVAQLDANPVASIGEIGLDRWMLDHARPDDSRLAGLRRAPIEEQVEVFRWQLALAAERSRPASVHCLEAFGAVYDTLRTSPRPAQGFLLHAYGGPAEMVPGFVKLGAYFSFNGAFLDLRKARLHALYATVIPADRLLIETDAPAMRLPADRERFAPLPAPDGALANHPANLASTYAALAALRQVPVETLTATVADNFQRLFGSL